LSDLNDAEQGIFTKLSESRHVFVPPLYRDIVSKIASQFSDMLDYHCSSETTPPSEEANRQSGVQTYLPEDAPYGYLKIPAFLYGSWKKDVDAGIDSIKKSGRRYIQARIPANCPSAIAYAEHLQEQGFVFLGFFPIYNLLGTEQFEDLLVMQWLDERTIRENPLPGETDSVIKIFGFPINLSGDLFKVIRRDLNALGKAHQQ
jgi:hypothetical protein